MVYDMIKELKIGNYVKHNGSIVSLYAISNPTPNKDKHFNNKARVTLWCNGLIDATIDEIEPIPITDELLLANGFEQCGYMFKTLFIEMYEVENGWHLHIDNEKFETAIALTIKYIHQLQNAYHLATGKELEIEL
jgi:hypothetical protein